MPGYTTKASLYSYVNHLRKEVGISHYQKPIDIKEILSDQKNISIEYCDFSTSGLCGIAFIGKKSDTIVLNNLRNKKEQNFDCAHELIHLSKHRRKCNGCFQCFESVRAQQDFFIEWQANEGAAELLIPYKELLPMVLSEKGTFDNWRAICDFKQILASRFGVSEAMIQYRLESLKYEIHQYINGVSLDSIRIVSNAQLSRLGIKVESINDIETRLAENEFDF